jgi:hypothetical protein
MAGFYRRYAVAGKLRTCFVCKFLVTTWPRPGDSGMIGDFDRVETTSSRQLADVISSLVAKQITSLWPPDLTENEYDSTPVKSNFEILIERRVTRTYG